MADYTSTVEKLRTAEERVQQLQQSLYAAQEVKLAREAEAEEDARIVKEWRALRVLAEWLASFLQKKEKREKEKKR